MVREKVLSLLGKWPAFSLKAVIWPLGIAVAAFLTVGMVWAIYWWSVAGQAMASLDAWMERQAREQRHYECLDRRTGGFPFRFTVQCSRFTARIVDRQAGSLEFEVAEPVFSLNMTNPTHLTIHAKGPLLRVGNMDNPQWEVRWQDMRAALQWAPHTAGFLLEQRPLSASVQWQDVIVHRLEKAAPDLVADTVGLEWRFDPATPDTANIGLTLQEAFWGTSKVPTQLTLGTQLNHLPEIAPQTLNAFLKEFSFQKGEILFTQVRFSTPEIDMSMRGDAGLDSQNRLKGTFMIHGKGIEQLSALLPDDVLPDNAGLAVIGARLAIDPGKLGFVAADGRLFVSGVPVMALAPLY